MALPNLSGSNIQDTFQRVLHTDGQSIFDGTGSTILSSTDLSSLQTMNNNTISNADWGYVETMDQHVNKTASVTYGAVSSSGYVSASAVVASSDIKALGNIYSSQIYYLSGEVVLFDYGGIGSLEQVVGTSDKKISLMGSSIEFGNALNIRHVTASGNISASGEIQFNNIKGGSF